MLARFDRRRYWRLLAGIVIAFSLAIAIWLSVREIPAGSVRDPPTMLLVVIGLTGAIALLPFAYNLSNGEDPLEPVVLVGGLFFLYYSVNAFGLTFLGLQAAFPAFIRESESLLRPLVVSLLVILMGLLALYAGYYGVTRRGIRMLTPTVGTRRIRTPTLLVVWFLSLAIYTAQTATVLPPGNALVTIAGHWHHYVPAGLMILYFGEDGWPKSAGPVIVVVLVEMLLLTALDFALKQVLLQIIFISVTYHYAGPGISYRRFGTITGGVIVLFPISVMAERLQAGSSLPEALFLKGDALLQAISSIVVRFIGVEALTMIVARTPDEVSFQNGETLLLTVYSFVPRVLWPGKPSIIMCGRNNLYFSGRGPNAGTCSAMTVPGELYWNFGPTGVIVGLFVGGILLALLYRWFIEQLHRTSNPYVIVVLYAIGLTHLMTFEAGVAQLLSGMVKELLVAGIFLGIVTRPGARQHFGTAGDSTLERSRFVGLVRPLERVQRPLHSTSLTYGVIVRAGRNWRRLRSRVRWTLDVSTVSMVSRGLWSRVREQGWGFVRGSRIYRSLSFWGWAIRGSRIWRLVGSTLAGRG